MLSASFSAVPGSSSASYLNSQCTPSCSNPAPSGTESLGTLDININYCVFQYINTACHMDLNRTFLQWHFKRRDNIRYEEKSFTYFAFCSFLFHVVPAFLLTHGSVSPH